MQLCVRIAIYSTTKNGQFRSSRRNEDERDERKREREREKEIMRDPSKDDQSIRVEGGDAIAMAKSRWSWQSGRAAKTALTIADAVLAKSRRLDRTRWQSMIQWSHENDQFIASYTKMIDLSRWGRAMAARYLSSKLSNRKFYRTRWN